MEIQVKKLREALELVAPVVLKKTSLPVLVYVRLGEGRLFATNDDVGVAVELPEANEPLLLPAKDALAFLKYTPGTAIAQIKPAYKRDYKPEPVGTLTITANDMETSFSSIPMVDEFPRIPEVRGEPSEGVLNGDALVRTLVSLAPYTATEDTRPILQCIYLATGDQVEAVAADGFRLIWVGIPGKLTGPSMNIPSSAARTLENLWKRAAVPDLSNVRDIPGLVTAPRLIRLNWDTALLKLSFDGVALFVKLEQGTFPNYRQIIPTETQPPVTVMADDMERVLAQVMRVAKTGTGTVRLVWKDPGVMKVSVKGEDQDVSVLIPASFTEPGKTALNISYLREYFKKRSGLVSLSTSGSGSPVLFTHQGRPHVLIMPMMVQWESKVVAQAEKVAEQASEPKAEEKPKRKRKQA